MDPLPLSNQVVKRKLYSFLRQEEDEVALVGLSGSEVCDSSYLIDRNGFPFFVLEFIEAGTMDIILDNEAAKLRRGGLLCYGPSSMISMTVPEGETCTKHFIAINPKVLDEIGSFASLMSEGTRVLIDRVPVIQVLKFINLISDLANRSDSWDALSRMIDALGCYLLLTPQEKRSELEGAGEAYRAITRFISENFMSLKSLDEIADKCGYDKSYLCQLYKRYATVSPYQQLIRMKIGYACILLETTDLKVKVISESLAFEDPLHFSRVFKQKVGVSPSQFRL
ncbi:AraC family transcriptional regulator [Puniceicoccaceae bacterium K14]|nr:AraC family transcriptional regulator [Puniceicoccaceae bacterium K14]